MGPGDGELQIMAGHMLMKTEINHDDLIDAMRAFLKRITIDPVMSASTFAADSKKLPFPTHDEVMKSMEELYARTERTDWKVQDFYTGHIIHEWGG